MKGNSYGNVRSTRERIMAEHGDLPAELRFLSCNTVANWSPDTFQSNYDHARAHGLTNRQAVAKVAARISRYEAEDTLKHYGPTHPEAPPAPIRKPRK